MTCSLDYNYRLNSSHSLKVQQLHFNQKTKKERKRIVLHFSLSHTHPHKHTHPQCIPTWLPLCLLFTLWDEQILGCNFYFLLLPSASLITAIISVLSCGKLWQWWFRAFGACESVNVCAWGCVTNVAVCWALHALKVKLLIVYALPRLRIHTIANERTSACVTFLQVVPKAWRTFGRPDPLGTIYPYFKGQKKWTQSADEGEQTWLFTFAHIYCKTITLVVAPNLS